MKDLEVIRSESMSEMTELEELQKPVAKYDIGQIEDWSKKHNPRYMPREQKQILKQLKNGKKLVRKKNGCRELHYSIHSPHLELDFCTNCDAYVQSRNKIQCECCGKGVSKPIKHTWLSRVLKFGIRQHRNFINDWARFPDQGVEYATLKNPYEYTQKFPDGTTKKIKVTEGYVKKPRRSQLLEIKYRDTVYEIEVKYLALALETNDGTDDIASIKGGEDAKLDIIKNHIGIKGLRIWIPDTEQIDTKCNKCNSFLRYDKDDNFFCPKCGKC